MKKIFVLDTNVPMLDPLCHEHFEDNDIVLPSIVVTELNNNKKRNDDKGRNCRHFTNYLESLENAYRGAVLPTGGTLKIVPTSQDYALHVKEVFNELTNDDYVLSVALDLHNTYIHQKDKLTTSLEKATSQSEKEEIQNRLSELKPVVLVSRDNNMRLKAKYFDLPAQNYSNDQIKSVDGLYTGWKFLEVSSETLNDYYMQMNRFKGDGDESFEFLSPETRNILRQETFNPNEYVVLVDKQTWNGTAEEIEAISHNPDAPVLKYVVNKDSGHVAFVSLVTMKMHLSNYNIFARNLHQKIMIDLLFDPNTKQKSIIGMAGSGKTLFALLISMILTNDFNYYDEIIITRPPVESEYNLGFLPGTEEEKMNPYLRGFIGNLKFIVNQKHKHKKAQKGQTKGEKNTQIKTEKKLDPTEYEFSKFNIRTESMGYMRGETTFRQIIIIDEAQNSTLHAMKTALTRVGDESLIIILGDISQIDYHLLDATSNGLSHAVELMKDDDIANHVTLQLGERSELSKRIAEKWDRQY